MSDAAREAKYRELTQPDRVKKDSEIPGAIGKGMVKLRDVEMTRPNPIEPWTKILAIKKILPLATVEVINAKDELSGTGQESYGKLLKCVIKWGANKRLEGKKEQESVDAVKQDEEEKEGFKTELERLKGENTKLSTEVK